MVFYNNSDANRDGERWGRPAQEEGDEEMRTISFPDSCKENKYG